MFQYGSGIMDGVSRLSDLESRSICAENPTGEKGKGKTKVLPPGANDPQGNTRQPESPYWWAGEWGEKVESRETLWGRSRIMSQ